MGTSFSSNVEYNSTTTDTASNLHIIINDSNQLIYAISVTVDKSFYILQGVSGITSTISSLIFIWMIMRSHDRLSTTQHRLLFGLCISDILSSLSWSTFNATVPSDYDYEVWNARGNVTTSNVQGFLITLGIFSGLYYNASLNLYFLAVVKYKQSEEYIRAKIEPFLHLLPIAVAISYSIYLLVKQQYNGHGAILYGPTYDAPHCIGYDAGEIPEGLEIPCLRGAEATVTVRISRMILMFIPAVIMIVCLGMIYSAVRTQEKKLAEYGLGSLNSDLQQQFSTPHRAVMHKAFGYTVAWFLAYGLYLMNDTTWEDRPLVDYICLPLQGLFNLLIFMFLKVLAAKKSEREGETVSWCNAFSIAFWSKVEKSKNQGSSRSNLRGRSNRPLRKNRNENAASDNLKSPMFGGITKKTKKKRNKARQEEEEKCEIQVPDNLNPNMTRAVYPAACPAIYARNMVPSFSTESTNVRNTNFSADGMMGMKKVGFVENVNVGNALCDIVEDPYEDPLMNQYEEEEMNDVENGNKEIMSMAPGADMKEQKKISMENEDEEKEMIAEDQA